MNKDNLYYSGRISFQNDGDYRVETDELKKHITEWNITDCISFYNMSSEDLLIEFNNLEHIHLMKMCEILVVNCRVDYIHSWMVKSLYDYLMGIYEWTRNNTKEGTYVDEINGNYEGTECYVIAHITKRKDTDKPIIIISDIDWDTDGEDVELPTTVIISNPENFLFDDIDGYPPAIDEYLSDKYGYCLNSFVVDILRRLK